MTDNNARLEFLMTQLPAGLYSTQASPLLHQPSRTIPPSLSSHHRVPIFKKALRPHLCPISRPLSRIRPRTNRWFSIIPYTPCPPPPPPSFPLPGVSMATTVPLGWDWAHTKPAFSQIWLTPGEGRRKLGLGSQLRWLRVGRGQVRPTKGLDALGQHQSKCRTSNIRWKLYTDICKIRNGKLFSHILRGCAGGWEWKYRS